MTTKENAKQRKNHPKNITPYSCNYRFVKFFRFGLLYIFISFDKIYSYLLYLTHRIRTYVDVTHRKERQPTYRDNINFSEIFKTYLYINEVKIFRILLQIVVYYTLCGLAVGG